MSAEALGEDLLGEVKEEGLDEVSRFITVIRFFFFFHFSLSSIS